MQFQSFERALVGMTDWVKLNQFLQEIAPRLGEFEEKVLLTEADLKDAPPGYEIGDVIRIWKPAKLRS